MFEDFRVSLTANNVLEQQSNVGKWEKGFVRYGASLSARGWLLAMGFFWRKFREYENLAQIVWYLQWTYHLGTTRQEAQESVQCKEEIDHLNYYTV